MKLRKATHENKQSVNRHPRCGHRGCKFDKPGRVSRGYKRLPSQIAKLVSKAEEAFEADES